jgi:NhaA family Na+:H+ antiporter
MENAVVGVGSPLQRSLHRWQLPVAVLIMPLFAFANAGITIDAASLQTAYRHPVTQGVVAGLLIGKPLGITAFAWLGVRLRLCSLPRGLTFAHIFGVGLVAGMGFTMSLFMTELAFFGQEDEIDASKAGILVGTFCAAFTGISWLRFTSRNSRKCDSEVTVAGT